MRELGWQRWPYYYRRNVATNRPVNALSAEERVQIEANNRLDQALYEYVKVHFEERIACEAATFQGEVQTFRRKNARYQRLVTPKMHAVNLWRRWKTAQE